MLKIQHVEIDRKKQHVEFKKNSMLNSGIQHVESSKSSMMKAAQARIETAGSNAFITC